MKTLILITSEYPYYSGEPFLQNEIPFLSKSFSDIYIFSINGKKQDEQLRELPSNVKCFPLGNSTSKFKYIKYIMHGVVSSNNDLKLEDYTPKKLIASLYTRGRAKCIAHSVYGCIKENGLLINDVTVYSFWFAYQAVAAWLLSEKLRLDGAKVLSVARAHGYDLYWERAAGGYLPYQQSLLKNLNWCFPCSDYGKNYLIEKYPWAHNKIWTQRLGTRDYGINLYTGEKVIVTCCNLEPLKRMSLFAKAFCKVARNEPGVKWICLGSGDEKEKIEKILKQARLSDRAVLMGRLDNEAVMEVYRNNSIMYFCNVSTSEGLPVSIMEAMSFGIPIIATDVGGTAELVDNSNGILLNADLDCSYLAQVLRDMININSVKYQEYRISSRKKWENLVSADNNYTAFCNIISKDYEKSEEFSK
jgi:glycosyltransferase involved in cell wall biosynthesis